LNPGPRKAVKIQICLALAAPKLLSCRQLELLRRNLLRAVLRRIWECERILESLEELRRSCREWLIEGNDEKWQTKAGLALN
jgi:hypothetical protein